MDDQTTPPSNNDDTSSDQTESETPSTNPEPATSDASVSPDAEPSAEATPETTTPEAVSDAESAPTASESVTAPSTTPGSVTTSDPTSGKRSKRGWLWLLVLIVLVAGGYAIYHSNQTSNKPVVAVKKDVPLLRVGISFPEPTSFYPAASDTDDTASVLDANRQMFQGLTGYENGTSVVPVLAQSWTNPDDNTWVFALRHGVKFHDGNLMTSAQVVASLNQVLPTDYGQEFAATIKSVTAVDNYTVKITTTSPDSLLPNKLTFLEIFDTSNTAKTDDPIDGTGPYMIKPGTTPSATETDMVAFPGYWGGHVYTREVQIKSYATPDDVLTALNDHQLDLGGNLSQPEIAKLDTTTFKVFNLPGAVIGQLVPNSLRAGPLANAKVRNAIWLALDPAAIAKAHGILATPVSQIVPQEIPGYDPSLTRPAANPMLAKQQIAAAGYPNGFSFTLTYFSPAVDTLAAEVQKELKAAGVTVVLDPETDGNVLVAKATSGSTDMFYNTEVSDLLDGSDVMSAYVQAPYYDNPQLDALYAQANQTFDAAKRLVILQKMSDLVYTDKATLPLYNQTYQWAEPKSPNLHLNYNEIGGSPGLNFSQVYSN